MARKRPCSVCRRWFEPDPRTAKWQRTCGRRECQRARHAKACAGWHAKNPGYDAERRLRERVLVASPSVASAPVGDPRVGLRWDVARDEMGLKVAVVTYELTGLLLEWARDGMTSKALGERRQVDRLPSGSARDERVPGGPSP
jgi:hypothetical protein